ncbi:MAG: right-handed parallel beta-helix repeat-containing protein [Lysobacterales bacterium]|jgi:hypothetical protein
MKRTVITVILTLAFTAFAIHAVEQTAFKGAGIIESSAGGFKFPDGSVQATAVTPACAGITYVPFTISSPGVYCFTGNLEISATSGNAIDIQSDNVVIDMNGWTLSGLGAGTGTAHYGFNAWQRKNITIRNGTIQGFYMGIRFYDNHPYSASQGHLIEDVRIDRSTYIGISVAGRGNIIRRNQIVETGGSTLNYDATGIEVNGPSSRIFNNDISYTEATSTGTAFGVRLDQGRDSVIENNRIHWVHSDAGATYGVDVTASSAVVVESNKITTIYGVTTDDFGVFISDANQDVMVVGNRIANAQYGVYYANTESWAGAYRDNIAHAIHPYTNGYDAGNNHF